MNPFSLFLVAVKRLEYEVQLFFVQFVLMFSQCLLDCIQLSLEGLISLQILQNNLPFRS